MDKTHKDRNCTHKIQLTKLQSDKKIDYAGIDILWESEKYLKNYNADIVDKLSKFTNNNSDVLDFGAALGTLSKIWHSLKKTKPECLEIDPSLQKILFDRGFICYKSLEEINKKYDTIFTSNVMEHIKDDVSVLKQLNTKIKANGFLAIYVPAFMVLYNRLDSIVGHYRRYEKDELIKKLLQANFRVVECYYVDSIGFFAWASLKFKKYGENDKITEINSLKIYDKYIYPFSRLLDNMGIRNLFGKNILVIAQKN
jgi:2-polyprenyl-3-methyl-5-hydroxy-6-metoxy-1,4-benzoquinol methylase